MDTIQAAILLEILEIFPDEVTLQDIGERYSSNLTNLNGIKPQPLMKTTLFLLSIQF